MKTNLSDVVEQYLEMPSDFAVLITGKWGTGKTFYLKNELYKTIRTTIVPNNKSIYYRPVYVSLFGITSIEDIEKRIFLDVFPNKSKFKSFTKFITKGVFDFFQISETSFLDKMRFWKNNLKTLDDIVVCFDDLERKTDSLSMKELIGYVNHLANDNAVKVLIVSDDTKFNPTDTNDFTNFKEKIIGLQVEYRSDFAQNFKNILAYTFPGEDEYHMHLVAFLPLFKDYLRKSDYNLRIFIYFLKYYHIVYRNLIEYSRLNKTSKPVLVDMITEQWESIFRFSLAVSIEFRLGRISFSNNRTLRNHISHSLINRILEQQNSKQDIEDEQFVKEFTEEYFGNRRMFVFIDSLYAHFTGGDKFNIGRFIDEFKELHHISDRQVLPEYYVLSKLGSTQLQLLSDEEYAHTTKRLLQYAYEGKYPIELYPELFTTLTRADNICDFDIDELLLGLKRGVEKSKATFTFSRAYLYSDALISKSPYPSHLKELIKFIEGIDNQVRSDKVNSVIQELQNSLFNSPRMLQFEMDSRQEFNNYRVMPFLHKIAFEQFKRQLLNWSNQTLDEFENFIIHRYSSLLDNSLKVEKNFLIDTSNFITQYLESNTKKALSKAFLKDISIRCRAAIDKLSSIPNTLNI